MPSLKSMANVLSHHVISPPALQVILYFVPLPCYHISEWECYQPLKEDHLIIKCLELMWILACCGEESVILAVLRGKESGQKIRQKHQKIWLRYIKELP